MRADFVRWRDEHFLAVIARLLNDRPTAREEAEDLHRALGELLGVGGRGGARTRERWVRCPPRKAATCPTCSVLPAPAGHGPYLERKEGKRWVKVIETPEQRKKRRERALAELQSVQTKHALALLETIHAQVEDDGLLKGEAAEAARREILRHMVR